MKKVLGIVLFLILCTGCSSNEESTILCKYETDLTSAEYTIETIKQEIKTITMHETMKFEEGYTDAVIETIWNPIVIQKYEHLNGIEIVDKGAKDNIYTVESKVDFKTIKMIELDKVKLIPGLKSDNYESLDKTLEGYKNSGMTCKKQ